MDQARPSLCSCGPALKTFVINVGDLAGVGRSAGKPMFMRRLELNLFDSADRRPDGGERPAARVRALLSAHQHKDCDGERRDEDEIDRIAK